MGAKTSKISILGVPLDLGAGRRGVDMGPSAMRIAGVAQNIRELGYEVRDEGNIVVTPPEVQTIDDPKLKYLPEIARTVETLAAEVGRCLGEGSIPLVLGGDHSMAIGTISAVSRHYAGRGEKVGLIWIDAHGDANTPQTTTSGNIHGMPLAIVFGVGAASLVGVGGFPAGRARLDPENAVLIGARSIDPDERRVLTDIGITVASMERIDREGMYAVMGEALKIATRGTCGFHVSFDIDSLDPDVATGVGTPARGGLTYREAHTMMEMISEAGGLLSLEVAEVNPILDVRNATAELAVELIASALGKRIL